MVRYCELYVKLVTNTHHILLIPFFKITELAPDDQSLQPNLTPMLIKLKHST